MSGHPYDPASYLDLNAHNAAGAARAARIIFPNFDADCARIKAARLAREKAALDEQMARTKAAIEGVRKACEAVS